MGGKLTFRLYACHGLFGSGASMGWLDRIFGRTLSNAGAQTSGTVEHLMTDQYSRTEADAVAWIISSHDAIPVLIEAGNFAWAANNYRIIAEKQTELGLLHWRRGLDPRTDFEGAIKAYSNLSEMAETQNLLRRDFEPSLVYPMLSLMGRTVSIEFYDPRAHEEFRIYCYQDCVARALHDEPLDDWHISLIDKHLAHNDDLLDRSFLTYFQLLGLRPTDQSPVELVRLAEANWAERRRDNFFADGPFWNGHGVMNELYVDVFLAGVLKKIGWEGESTHRWKWELQ